VQWEWGHEGLEASEQELIKVESLRSKHPSELGVPKPTGMGDPFTINL